MQKKRDTKPELLRVRRSKEAGTSGKYGWFVVSEFRRKGSLRRLGKRNHLKDIEGRWT